MKNKIINFFKGIGAIFLYFLTAGFLVLFFNKYINNANHFIEPLKEVGIYAILLLIMAIIYHKKLFKDIKEFKKEYLKIAFKNYLIGLGSMIIANTIINNFTKSIPLNEETNRLFLHNFPIASSIIMIFLAPLIEEITFRLSFKKAFSNVYIYSFFTGLLFGLAHITTYNNPLELLYVIPYGALGFFFAKAFFETDNIYTSYIMHIIHNTLCILIILFLK